MQKISPLRSSIEAFNRFKASRKLNQAQENRVQTNPFGITFKGKFVQSDVFESENSKTNNSTMSLDAINERLQNAGKLLTSAWVGTINKFSNLKANVVSFGNTLKEKTIATAKKIYDYASAPIDFNIFRYNVAALQTAPVDELRSMLTNELQGVKND